MATRTTINRNVSIPLDLDAARKRRAPDLPSLSLLTQRSLRAALRRLGEDVPEPPEPGRQTAAAEARRKARAEAPENS